MIVCPKCQKELADGSVFCDNCGCDLQQTVACPGCGADVPTRSTSCPVCGSSITTNTKKKAAAKKIPLIIPIIAGILVVAIVAGMFILSPAKENNALYFKDDNFYSYNFAKDEKKQISNDLFEDSSLNTFYSLLSDECTFSEDGKTLFFPDRINADGYSLYYSPVGKSDSEKVKISSKVSGYQVNKKGDTVTYGKQEDHSIYQFYLKDESNEKIATGVEDGYFSEDGNKIYYLNEEGGLYLWEKGKDKDKIDSSVDWIEYVSEKFDFVIYVKDSSLYIKRLNEDKEKIESNFDTGYVVAAYDTGEIYYAVENKDDIIKFSDVIENDATDNYIYNQAYDQLKDEAIEEMSYYTLSYYNGEESVAITDEFLDGSYIVAEGSPAVIYARLDLDAFKKIKLSEMISVGDLDDFGDNVTLRALKAVKWYLNIGAEENDLEVDGTIKTLIINENANIIYYVTEGNNDYGDLYKITIDKNKVSDAKLFDSDVHVDYVKFLGDDKIAYCKDVKIAKNSADLYIEKQRVDYDVDLSNYLYVESKDQLIYFTEWDDVKKIGTLKIFNGKKSQKISDDVYDFGMSLNGDVLYLYDYSLTYERGDLFIFEGNGNKKIDTDVTAIFSVIEE